MGDLPAELWAQVFQKVSESYFSRKPGDGFGDVDMSFWQRHEHQALFGQLSSVCKRFREGVVQHSKLPRSVYLEGLPATKQASFSAWAAKHAAGVHFLELNGIEPEQLTECLRIMAASASKLRSIQLFATLNFRGVEGLGAFHSLQKCEISGHSTGQLLELQSLESLQNLEEVCLKSGRFTNVRLAPSLLSMHLSWGCCTFAGPCPFTSTLQYLEVQHSTMMAFGNRGLLECTALQQLKSYQAAVEGKPDALEDPFINCHIDHHITTMKQLNTLQVDIGSGDNVAEYVNFDWLYNLTTLTSLTLMMVIDAELSHLTQLSQLCELSILGCCDHNGHSPQLELDISWDCMQNLQRLSIAGSVSIGLDLLNLLTVPCLKKLSFSCEMLDHKSNSVFAIFMYRLAKLRPDVKVSIGRVPDLPAKPILSV